MSLIRLLKMIEKPSFLTNQARNFAYYHADWKPAPYPLTDEERIAAAKKYNLLPADYKPYLNNGSAAGDYPKLDTINLKYRDPFEHYDYYPIKRDWNEPIPWFWDLHHDSGNDIDFLKAKTGRDYSSGYIFARTFGPLAIFVFAVMWANKYRYFSPMMAKPFLNDGTTYYSFESPNEEKHSHH